MSKLLKNHQSFRKSDHLVDYRVKIFYITNIFKNLIKNVKYLMSKSAQSKNKVLETLKDLVGISLKFPKYKFSKHDKNSIKQECSGNSLSSVKPNDLQKSENSFKYRNKSKNKNAILLEEEIIQHEIAEFNQFAESLSNQIAYDFGLHKEKGKKHCTRFVYKLVIENIDKFVENSSKQFVINFVNGCNSFFKKDDNSILHKNIKSLIDAAAHPVGYDYGNPILNMAKPPPFEKPEKLEEYRYKLQKILKKAFFDYQESQASDDYNHVQPIEPKSNVFAEATNSVKNDQSAKKLQQTEQQYIGQLFASYGSFSHDSANEDLNTKPEKLLLGDNEIIMKTDTLSRY